MLRSNPGPISNGFSLRRSKKWKGASDGPSAWPVEPTTLGGRETGLGRSFNRVWWPKPFEPGLGNLEARRSATSPVSVCSRMRRGKGRGRGDRVAPELGAHLR